MAKKIILYRNKGVCLVSDCDYVQLANMSWALAAGKYAVTCLPNGKRVYMHRMVCGVTDRSLQVDHRNHNPLDNRRSNLRVVTNAQNQMNRVPTSKSGFKGVHHFPRNKTNPWMATIMFNRKPIHLGYFKSAKAAAKAYNKKAVELFGKFAYLNPV